MRIKAFTLIEIIIVIVILGILAALALPRIMGQIDSSKSAEVMNMFGAIKTATTNCVDAANGDGAGCVTWTHLGMSAPTATKFTYTSTYTDPEVLFYAQSNSGASQGDFICMSIHQLTGAVSYSYTGILFGGIVNRTGAGGAFACAAGSPM